MKLIQKSKKEFKGGYSKEEAMMKLGFDALEEMENQKFSVLNIETLEQKEVEYIRIYVHTELIPPFSVKLENSAKLQKILESLEMYDSIKFNDLECVKIKNEKAPTCWYFRANGVEV